METEDHNAERPLSHAARKEIVNGIEGISPLSILSARTQSASAGAFSITNSGRSPFYRCITSASGKDTAFTPGSIAVMPLLLREGL